ncbi:MAG: hypothetical protein A2104_06760 [Candidatus Melainabacteria bacterium GWF2_32_7]|nr:MAG: hypothetical protein A2104_06760 [Candidatus Melainabacteria bacterium GWF2_32_7]
MKKNFLNNIFVKFVISLFFLFQLPGLAYNSAFQAGIDAYNMYNYPLAEQYFRKALMNEPNKSTIRYYLAITLVKNKKVKEAQSEYMAIIDAEPNSEAAYKAVQGLKLIGVPYNKTSKRVVLNINDSNSALVVKDVVINSKLGANFILDTGATYTTISYNLARNLDLLRSDLPRVSVMTANGRINAPKVVLNSVEIDGLVARNVEVMILDIGASKDISGLLGLNFIQKFKLTIDKKNGQLILETP